MTPERFRYVRDVFEEALEHSTDTRAAFVHERCGGDVEVSAQVQAMLGADAEDGNAIDRLAASSRQAVRAAVLPGLEGTRIGPYVVESRIGGGGMGVVYKATRADGAFQKQVALKIIRPEHVNQDSLHRFRQERQILAGLDHPNIARVLDGGSTPDGLPYLVMEYIEGTPIRAYCEAHDLSITDRLTLFRAVTDAVAYAHRHLIVHRDLKPSNILVTADGSIKLLDFGIAKLMPAEADATLPLETQAGLLAMTPAYASPEQVLGRRVTTSSDVYSLGIILFELLAGTRPYDLTGKPLPEMLRLISEADVSTPSSCVTAAYSGSRWRRALTGDLDCIVLKALRKDASDRYSSVEQFSDDIERYLCGLPVQATRQTAAYHAVKFVKRHTAGVTAALVSVCALAAGLLAALSYADAMQQARNTSEVLRLRAESEAGRADAEATAARSASMEATRERDRAVAARQDAERQKRTAEFERRRAEAHAILSAERFSLAWQLIEASLDTPRTRLPRTLVALQRLERSVHEDPAMRQKLRAAYIRTADQLAQTSRPENVRSAAVAYEGALSLYPPQAHLTRAERMEVSSLYDKISDAERRQGHFELALTHIDRAVGVMPDAGSSDGRRMHAIANERKAALQLRLGRIDAAKSLLLSSITLSDKTRHHSVFEQFARTAYASRDYAGAELALSKAIELLTSAPAGAVTSSERLDSLARLHEIRGDIGWLQHAGNRALRDYDEAITYRTTQQAESARQVAFDAFHVDLGMVRRAMQHSLRVFDAERDGRARAISLQGLVNSPLALSLNLLPLSKSLGEDNRPFHGRIIATFAKTKRHYEHLRVLSRVLLKRGLMCLSLKERNSCAADFVRTESITLVLLDRTQPDIGLVRQYADVHEHLGIIAHTNGDVEAARRHYGIALMHVETAMTHGPSLFRGDLPLEPDSAPALPLHVLERQHSSLATVVPRVLARYASVSPTEMWALMAARELFEKAQARPTLSANDLINCAWWLLEGAPEQERDAVKAKRLAERATEMTDNDPDVMTVLASAAYKSGNYKGAIETQRKLVQLRPWDRVAADALSVYERRPH